MKKYLADERRALLARLINEKGSIRIGELADFFGVSRETIRKDIISLDQQKLVCKTHGGAVAISESRERPIEMRSQENAAQKERIAMKALDYVHENQVILLDSGSTVLTLARMLDNVHNCTLITNSLPVASVLSEKGLSFHLIGGEFSPITMATSGMLAAQALNMIKADIVFLGTSGFQSSSGPSAKAFCDAQIKQDMIRNSRFKIVLADSSKFHTNAFVRFANWTEIDLLITNEDADPDMVKELQKVVEVVLV